MCNGMCMLQISCCAADESYALPVRMQVVMKCMMTLQHLLVAAIPHLKSTSTAEESFMTTAASLMTGMHKQTAVTVTCLASTTLLTGLR